MSYKYKIKIEKFIFRVLLIMGFGSIGAFLGVYLAVFEDKANRALTNTELLMYFIIFLFILFFSFFVNICLHEVGHMIFGLLTGYKFNSIRFGKLIVVKRNGKLKICQLHMPGTGGQCIMSAPERDIDDVPVILYNLGGLILNLLSVFIGVSISFMCMQSHMIISMAGLIFALTALIIFITNGIPFEQLGTDGANAIVLHKNKLARKAFCNQLDTINYISNNYSIREMPKELFEFDESVPMNHPLITAQAVNYYNYLTATKQFDEAKRIALLILKNATSINELHQKILFGELIFIAAVVDKDMEKAKELYHLHKKELRAMSGFISTQRAMYAYFTLVEPNEKKANEFASRFVNSVKRYPYPKDAEIEQEQFDMIVEQHNAVSSL